MLFSLVYFLLAASSEPGNALEGTSSAVLLTSTGGPRDPGHSS
jgi:hypothetical protein